MSETPAVKQRMGGNELAFRRMMKALQLRQVDQGNPALASLARNGLELARLLDGTLDPRDRVACVRELRQVTERLLGSGPIKTSTTVAGSNGSDDIDDDDWDTPSTG